MTLHVHRCRRCEQAELHCSREDCAVTEPWICPSCDAVERDEYWQAVELELTQPEPNRNRVLEDLAHEGI